MSAAGRAERGRKRAAQIAELQIVRKAGLGADLRQAVLESLLRYGRPVISLMTTIGPTRGVASSNGAAR